MNKDVLSFLCSKGLSVREIGRDQGCSATNVRYWLKKFELSVKRGARGKLPKDLETIRRCPCGEIDPAKFYGNKKHTCAKCHNADVIARGKAQVAKIRESLGGKCVICGYDKYQTALDIHHLDPKQKDPNFKTKRSWSWERILLELKGCALLCKCCHGAYHAGELSEEDVLILKGLPL